MKKNLDGDMEIIAGNAFRPDNNVEIASVDQNGISYKRYHEFLGNLAWLCWAWGVAEHMENFNDRYVVSYSCSFAITYHFDWDGQVRFANTPIFCLWIWRIWASLMPYHPEYSIITNIDFDHPDYFTNREDVSTP